MTVTISEDENDGDDKSYSLLVGHSYNIQLFWERLSEKMCMWQSREVICDMINTLFLTLLLSKLLLLRSFSTCKCMSMAFCAILSNFIEKIVNSKSPAIPFAIVLCTFSDNLSRNSCVCILINHRCTFALLTPEFSPSPFVWLYRYVSLSHRSTLVVLNRYPTVLT